MNKKGNIALGVCGSILVLGGLAANTTFSILSMQKIKSLQEENRQYQQQNEEKNQQMESGLKSDIAGIRAFIEESGVAGNTTENDVVIAEEYKILSTETISDAYLSGDTSALTDREKETLDMAKKVIDEVIKDGMSDYEKEKAIYHWMCDNLGYDSGALVVIPTTEADVDNPYGVLKNHKAVCVGYATTFRLFMHMLNIECMVVHNTDCYHSWDLVKIDNNWYHTDIYADVGVGNYANFNVNDEIRMTMQSWDTNFFPAATSLEYNESFKNRKILDSPYDAVKVVYDLTQEEKGGAIYLGLKDCSERNMLLLQELMDKLENSIYNLPIDNGSIYMNYDWTALKQDDTYFMSVTITIDSFGEDIPDDPSEYIIDDDYTDIQNAISEYFEYFDKYSWDDDWEDEWNYDGEGDYAYDVIETNG